MVGWLACRLWGRFYLLKDKEDAVVGWWAAGKYEGERMKKKEGKMKDKKGKGSGD